MHQYLQDQPAMTLEFLCFHKNWNDRADVDATLDSSSLMERIVHNSGVLYSALDNFTLLETSFNGKHFKQILLSAPTVRVLQIIAMANKGYFYLPFVHFEQFPSYIV